VRLAEERGNNIGQAFGAPQVRLLSKIICPINNALSSKSVGFARVDIYGAKLGQFSRSDALTTEDYEMLVIAER